MENVFTNDVVASDLAIYDFFSSVSNLCEMENEIEAHDVEHLEMVLKPLLNMFNRKKAKNKLLFQAKVA